MLASQVAEEIIDYLPLLSGEQQEAVLHVVKMFASSQVASPNDAEIIRRLDALKSGADKGFTWQEVKQRARQNSL